MKLTFTGCAAAAVLVASTLAPAAAQQISDDVVRIGVLTDMTGPYSDGSGMGALKAVRMAVSDFGGTVLGKPIEVVHADHQNKPDIGAARAREWFAVDKVDMIVDLVNSAVAVAVQAHATEVKRVVIVTAGGSSALSNQYCSPYAVQYAYDTYALSTGAVKALAEKPGQSWYFVAVDYTFGQALESDARSALEKLGGKVAGSVRHPLNASDFSSYVLSAQNAKPDVLAIASGASDFANMLRATREFGLGRDGKPQITGLFVLLNDLKGVGLEVAQGMTYVDSFYWDMDERSREFSRRFLAEHGAMPSFSQAADYSATIQYLKAIEAEGTDNADAVMQRLRATKFDDFFLRNAWLREDGRMIKDMYLMEAKKPSESGGEWDLAKLVKVIPGEDAYRPLADSACPLIKKN
ncbi:MAG TPA: ABC transporter substrate-binding protein [Burkholderiaceae bacterium]|nr:ABC transporter substrate-binding protein [Burkholderiaceae bacterium]